jgi:hypothetical protein
VVTAALVPLATLTSYCVVCTIVVMNAYIEVVGAIATRRHDLNDWELRNIGEFTRENVAKWLNSRTGADWVEYLPAEDFRAVCGDMEIPWASKEAEVLFNAPAPYEIRKR